MEKVQVMKEEHHSPGESKALVVVDARSRDVQATRSLVFYNSARAALEKAASIDEVKDIRNKAEAMRAYSAQAKDQQLQIWANEIRARAERRAGEMLIGMGERGERLKRGGDRRSKLCRNTLKLSDLGLDRFQSQRWQAIARMPEKKFERAIAEAAEQGAGITISALYRAATPKTEARLKRERWEAERRKQEDLDDEATMEDNVRPENYRDAFFLRTDTARRCAVYSGPIDREIIESARNVAKAWTKLADKLEEQL